MRIAFISLLTLALACATTPPAPTPAEQSEHGLTIQEEATILALEDRREFDAGVVSAWIKHKNALHRNRMAVALARIGAHAFIDANGNGERDPEERQAGVDELMALAHDSEPLIRTTVAFALGEIGDPTAIDVLFRLAGEDNASVATEAAEGLAKMARQVPIERYAALANNGGEGVRARAIRYLFRFDSDEASAIAEAHLDSSSPVLRQEAVYALARRAYKPAREKIELLLADPNVLTRAYAAAALGRIAASESIPTLVRSLLDPHPWVRTNSVVALGRVAAAGGALSGEQLPSLLAMTTDPDPGTRAASIDTLGYAATGHEAARKRLFEIASNGSRWERELAAGAIAKQFGDSDLSLIPADLTSWGKVRVLEAAAQLKKNGEALRRRFSGDPDRMVRAWVISTIPDESVDENMDLVRPALVDPDVIIRANAVEKYAASKKEPEEIKLTTLLAAEEKGRSDRENDARLSAIRALAEIDYGNRQPFLRSLLTDGDPVIRRVAADAIEQTLDRDRPQYTPLSVRAVDYAEIAAWARDPHTATIHMTRGLIEVQLLPHDAPMTAWNFARLAGQKYFDNTTFMRVVPNFVIQGGDPRNDQNGGPGYSIRDEINLQKYTRGAMGMALSGPDTGGSQFFITHSPQPHLDGGYTIFGRVYSGMSGVVDQAERGDRVETITIDEHAAATTADLAAVQTASLPLEIGTTSEKRLLAIIPEYTQRKSEYQPDETVVEMIAEAIQPGDRIEVYSGTWCSDSLREVPRFLKITETIRNKFGKELPISLVAVDRSKTKPEELLAGKTIEKVPTFIYYRGDRELGRIVESTTSLFEDDLLAIVAR